MDRQLRAALQARGARFEEQWGAAHVISHGDVQVEYLALRDDAGVLPLTVLKPLWVRGSDAADYLHRCLSNSVRSLAMGDGCHAALLRPEGKMIAELTLHRTAESEFLALASPLCVEEMATALEKYIFTEDCEVVRASEGWGTLGVAGPGAARILQRVVGGPVCQWIPHGCQRAQFGDQEITVVRSHLTALPILALVTGPSGLAPLWTSLVEAGALPCGLEALHIHRVEAGIPMFGVDHDSDWMPADAGIESVVDFEKGCFPGQEAVAKVRNVGHPRQVLVGLRFEDKAPPPQGAELRGTQGTVGSVASVCISPALGHAIGLGHVKWRWREEREALEVRTEGVPGRAHVVPLPFVGAAQEASPGR